MDPMTLSLQTTRSQFVLANMIRKLLKGGVVLCVVLATTWCPVCPRWPMHYLLNDHIFVSHRTIALSELTTSPQPHLTMQATDWPPAEHRHPTTSCLRLLPSYPYHDTSNSPCSLLVRLRPHLTRIKATCLQTVWASSTQRRQSSPHHRQQTRPCLFGSDSKQQTVK